MMLLAHDVYVVSGATQTGISLGSAIAVVCSWHRSRSIIWTIIHGTLGWFYVIYFALTREPDEVR